MFMLNTVKKKILNKMEVVKNISYNQHEILYQIMQMHNNGKPFECDMTYSKGCFYGEFNIKRGDGESSIVIPPPIHKFDVFPQVEDCIKIEPLGKLPLDDNSISSIVIDLPFVVSTGPSLNEDNGKKTNIISKRFHYYYPVSELYRSYYHWISEAARVLKDDGICVFKLQPTISGGVNHQIDAFSMLAAQECGMEVEDMWLLLAKTRIISGKVKTQQHARKYHSNFFVFKKPKSNKYKKFNYMNIINNLKENIHCEDIYKVVNCSLVTNNF